ncbi:MAG TPA: dienelactone hydrolase family protein, partial [Chthoniobacteraceae bacterium]|nr:dienelactone hydrolase family protein [Chthoniobacteraceae bacterium]
ILVVHDWLGVGDYVKGRAEQLARLGYIAFVADIYGKGVRPQNAAEAAKVAGIYKNDRALFRARVTAALDQLKKDPDVDPSRIAAIGYCFGGTAVLELARSGADIAGIVSFHGGLDTPTPEDAKNIKCKVLILHGADDPLAPAAQVAAVEDEMRKANVDYQITLYGGAVHAFTREDAGSDNSKGAAYNEKADKRSWQAMKDFFAEIFNPPAK